MHIVFSLVAMSKTVKQIPKKDFFFKHFILHLIEKRIHLYAEP